MQTIAAIDIGTNTIILLIADYSDQQLLVRHYECQLVRLGEDIQKNHFFLDAAMQRAFLVLQAYKNTLNKFECKKVHVVATAAARLAKNFSVFHQMVLNKLRLNIKIISGDEEARLIHLAIISDFAHIKKPFLVVDIGGGSTELILDTGKKLFKNSFPFGAVTLTDRFLLSDPPAKQQIKALCAFVKETLQTSAFADKCPPSMLAPKNIIAPAGTPTTLCAIHKGLTTYDPEHVHKEKMTQKDLQTVVQKLQALTLAEREKIPCLPALRADVIVAGSYILNSVMDFFQLNNFWISDHGLAFGVVLGQKS